MSDQKNRMDQMPGGRAIDPERMKIVEEYGELGLTLLSFGWNPEDIRELITDYKNKREQLGLLHEKAPWVFNKVSDREYSYWLLTYRPKLSAQNIDEAEKILTQAIVNFCTYRAGKLEQE